MIFINVILAAIFWNMVDEAVNDDRPGWGFTYLFISAMNGAAVLADIFQECKMDLKETMIVIGGILLFFGMLFFTTIYEATMKEECRLAAIEQNYTAVEIQAICK